MCTGCVVVVQEPAENTHALRVSGDSGAKAQERVQVEGAGEHG